MYQSLNWTIGNRGSHNNETKKYNIKFDTTRGKTVATLHPGNEDFIYLNFYKNDYSLEPQIELQNYIFKYINVESEDQFFDYIIVEGSGKLDIKEDENKISVTFKRIDKDSKETNVTYFLKIWDYDKYIPYENFNTVALTESLYYTVFKRNPKIEYNNTVTLTAERDFSK